MANSPQPTVSELLEDVPCDYSIYRDKWSETYSDKFKNILNDISSDGLDEACEFAGIDMSEGAIFSELLSKSDRTVFLFTLYRFLNDKRLPVRDLAKQKGDRVLKDEEYSYVLSKINEGDSDIVFHIQLYSEWLDSNNKSNYRIKNSLPDDYENRFDGNSRGIRLSLSRGTRAQNFQYNQRRKLSFSDFTIFAISRQTSDSEKLDVTGAQRRRDVRNVFLKVDADEQLITIDTKSKGIRETLLNKCEELFSVLTEEADFVEDTDVVSRSTFEDEFSRHDIADDEDIKLLNAEFRNTNVQPSLPLSVSKQSVEKEIRPVVAALSEEVIDVKLTNIRRFWFESEGVEVRVTVEENVDRGFLRLNTIIKTRSERKSNRIKERFRDRFAIPLDKKIPLHWITKERGDLISRMLKGVSYWETRYIQDDELVDTLVNSVGVLNRKDVNRKQCSGCERFYQRDHDDCPNCGNELEVFDTSFELNLSESGLRSYFRQKVKEEGLVYYGTKREKIYGKEYKFVQIGNGSDIIRVLLNTPDTNLTSGSAEHLRKSIQPVLVLNPGTVLDESLIKEVTSETIDLSEMLKSDLDGSLPDDYISDRLEKVARNTEKRISDNAVDAFEHLQKVCENPDDYRGEEFEQDAFHILKQAISNLEQWGTKRRGNQPDGFGELLFFKGGKNYFRSFAYDGKFTTSDEMSMPTKEANTLSDYALRIYKSEEVQKSDSKFMNFIVITNAKPGNFGSVGAKKLNRMQSWDGVPVLMHSNFLLGLHVGLNENSDVIRDNIHAFYEEFYKCINGGKMYHQDADNEFFVHVTGEDVEELFNNVDDRVQSSGLDIDSLREFLEEDIIPV
jgi:hypothetical protein